MGCQRVLQIISLISLVDLITVTKTCTVHPTQGVNSCIAIDRLMIELLDFHIPFLSFPNAGFKGYGKKLLNRRLRITQLS